MTVLFSWICEILWICVVLFLVSCFGLVVETPWGCSMFVFGGRFPVSFVVSVAGVFSLVLIWGYYHCSLWGGFSFLFLVAVVRHSVHRYVHWSLGMLVSALVVSCAVSIGKKSASGGHLFLVSGWAFVCWLVSALSLSFSWASLAIALIFFAALVMSCCFPVIVKVLLLLSVSVVLNSTPYMSLIFLILSPPIPIICPVICFVAWTSVDFWFSCSVAPAFVVVNGDIEGLWVGGVGGGGWVGWFTSLLVSIRRS